jgi:hypothetical protein
MAQTQVFRGVQTQVTRGPNRIYGNYRGTVVAEAQLCEAPFFNRVRITLNTGGWKSNTTKLRMNQFARQFCNSQYGVYQKAGEWFVSINGVVNPVKFTGHTVVFVIDAQHVQFK